MSVVAHNNIEPLSRMKDKINRRSFLAKTGVISGAILAPPALYLGQPSAFGETLQENPAIPQNSSLKPNEAKLSILVNQVGYNLAGTKVLLLQVRDEQLQPKADTFELVDESRRMVFRGKLVARDGIHQGKKDDWNSRYWTGEFSKFKSPGTYQARLLVGSEELVSFPFRIGEHLIFQETASLVAGFFHWQRCGFAIPGLHEACHLDDAKIPNELGGGHLDARGGWHDAGDFNKYSSIACRSVYALVTLARDSASLLGVAERKRILDEAAWGADFLHKMWQPGKGILYHDVFNGYGYWGDPAKETDGVPGTKDDRPLRGQGPSAMSAAALAAVAIETGRAEYREAAEDLWRGAVAALSIDAEDPWVVTSGGVPKLEDDVAGRRVRRTADLLLANLELDRLTGNPRYAISVRQCVESLLKDQRSDGLWPSDAYSRSVLQGVPAAALALYSRTHGRDSQALGTKPALKRWLQRNLALASSPFEITPWDDGVFFNPYIFLENSNHRYWSLGQNSQYLSQAWAFYLVGGLLKDPRARRLADRQIDWVLGMNPLNLCMLEGRGCFNPPRYLHRWAPDRDRGAVPGAIPNGIRCQHNHEDVPYFEISDRPVRRIDYSSTEPWEPHNAFFLLALSAGEKAQ